MRWLLLSWGLALACGGTARAAAIATDAASDAAYDSGWTNGANGGSGFGPWLLTADGHGGHFTASSTQNAGDHSGGIDTAGRAWGLWSTNGVTEAFRALTGGALNTGQVLHIAFDNGWISGGRSAGIGLRNASGSNLWEFFFSGGTNSYYVNDRAGVTYTTTPFTGDGLEIAFQLTGPTSYLARVMGSVGKWSFSGGLLAQADPGIAQVRCWNYEAGAGSNYNVFINSLSVSNGALNAASYLVADTAQTNCYGDATSIAPPASGQPFYGQDAQLYGNQPAYRNNGDGTISDLNTGLMWVQSRGSKMTWSAALAGAATNRTGGYSDWRLPTIKELYSLILFSGTNGPSLTNATGYIPFLDTNYFGFTYGSGVGSERVIDCQDWSATRYVSTTMVGDETIFGVNFADGRIKGYPRYDPSSGGTTGQLLYVRYVRGNPGYGMNSLVDNGDGTLSDNATGLMWPQADSGAGMNWSNALAWVQARNATNYLGYNDWRLPNAKELQSLVDYARSPATTASAAIDPKFACTAITNEGGAVDYPFYWAGSTHLDGSATPLGVYVCFGRALGWMQLPPTFAWQLLDVHGAGAQRSDPKFGDPAAYPHGRGPQGDVVRISNFVRVVRGGYASDVDHVGDGISDAWRRRHFGGSGTSTDASSCATCDIDSDHMSNWAEWRSGTQPTNGTSYLGLWPWVSAADGSTGLVVRWAAETGIVYRLQRGTSLLAGFITDVASNLPGVSPACVYTDTTASTLDGPWFYRVAAE